MYVCYTCGAPVEVKKIAGIVFCPKCSGRVFMKVPAGATRTVGCD